MPSDFNEEFRASGGKVGGAPPFAEYEKTAAPRVIPVVVLDPVA
jgi:hypothetical protein